MASVDFLSLRFENISENENDTYSVFLNEGEDGPEMVWYDSMGDPIIEVGISKSERVRVLFPKGSKPLKRASEAYSPDISSKKFAEKL